MPTVARFNVTPVKSTALHHPEWIRLEERGAVGDREFFFVDPDGRRLSTGAKPPLLPIRASFDPERDRLELRLPNGAAIQGSARGDGRAFVADFYGRAVPARILEGPFTEALTDYLGHEVRLARPDRPSDALDVRPVTLVSLESVAELARHGGHEGTLEAGRFRMTMEIEGVSEPHEEDAWRGRRVRVGEAILAVEDPVPRCVITTLDPSTGRRDFPTLRVIKEYRGVSPEGDLQFGVYASVARPGTVRVGDPVEPL